MRNYKTRGFIIKRHNLGEADRILVIFSHNLGKIRVVAKGVRRGKSKLAGHLEPYIETELHLAKGRNLDVVTGARGQRYYRLDGKSLEVVSTAYLLLEVIDQLMAEGQASQLVYDLLNESLASLETGVDYELTRHYFFVKFLALTGQQPNLALSEEAEQYYLYFDNGVIKTERLEGQAQRTIAPSVIKLWRLIYGNDLDQISRIGGVNGHLAEAQELIELFYEYHLHIRFKSEWILS